MKGFIYPLTLLLVICGIFAGQAAAEIYRYQDKNGKWHFTDKRPKPAQQVDLVEYGAVSADPKIMDLEASLTYKFNPQSVLQRSSLAVVSIQSPVSTGIGFFISPYGHLVTHRHLVRPAETASWQQSKQALDKQRLKLEEIKRELNRRKDALLAMEKLFSDQKESLAQLNAEEKKKASRDYRVVASRLTNLQEELNNYQGFYQQRKGEYERENAKFAVLSATVLSTKEFKVQLKDRTELTATLLAVSDAHELALLRVSGLKTPHIDYATAHASVTGAKVFALGSPVEREDPITAGVITHVFKDVLVTDMVLHSTENGGPLINKTGQLVGVNTQIPSSKNLDPDLFGAAVPSQTLLQEFGGYLTPGLAQN